MNSFQSEIRRGSGSVDLNPKSEQIKTFQGSSFFAAGDGAGEEPRDTPKDSMDDFFLFMVKDLVSMKRQGPAKSGAFTR